MRRAATPPDLPGLRPVRLIGSGGFSDVFLYEQELPRRQVAVKILTTEDLTDASRSAFVAEANLMAQLSAHPYIVTIYHAAVAADGRPYFVMEYCAGPSLAEQYKSKRFSVADALRTGIRLTSAVATAHAAGILHRDIKPANVMTNAYGWPALTDFGISSAVESEFPANTTTRAALSTAGAATATGTVGMSIPWSPPEMFDDHPTPDVRSDVFSLAATVYTLLAGHSPFEVPGKPNGAVDLIGRIDRGTITPIDRGDIPMSLTSVLYKGMSARRETRFASAIEFARALQRVELELSYAPTAIDVPNLHVAEQHRSDASEPDGADPTRVRQIPSVAAQPAPASPPVTPHQPAPPVTAPAQGGDATVVRSVQAIEQDPVATPDADDRTVLREQQPLAGSQPGETADSSRGRKRWLPAVLIGAGAVVVAGAVTAAIVLAPPPEEAGPEPTASSGIDVDGVPTPEQVTIQPSQDGTRVTFTWENPEPREGDRYIWRRSDGPQDGQRTPTDAESVTIEQVAPGSQVCITVEINRNGRLSTEPLQMCTS